LNLIKTPYKQYNYDDTQLNQAFSVNYAFAPNATLSGKLQLAKISEERTKSQL
jgi:hypothetical protein